MYRRQFIILGSLSTAGALVGSAVYRVGGVWWNQDAAPQYRVLSAREALIAESIVDASFPGDAQGMPNGNDVGVIDLLDDYLAALEPHKSKLLRLLLHAIDEIAVVAGLGLTRFHKRPRQERAEVLKAWETSSISARREAFGALKIVLAMGYCEAPQVLRAARIDYECGDWA